MTKSVDMPDISNPPEPEVSVTDHAKKRFKERLGLPKRACLRQATKAFNHGFKHSNAKGRAKRYLDGLFLRYKTANNMRVYGGSVYIFIGSNLITVMSLPSNMLNGFKLSK